MDAPMVAKELGVQASNVYKILIRHGVDRRDKSACHRSHDLNEGAFDVATPDALYWAGFLMADGSITSGGKSRSPTVTMDLALEDREHVLAFRDFLGATHPIQERGESFRLQVRSKRLVEALGRWGVVAKKQAREEARGEAADSIDFWRGFFDGDGCYSFRKDTPQVTVCGSMKILEQFRDFVGRNIVSVSNEISKSGSIFQIHLYGERAYRWCKSVDGARPFLPRKQKKATQMIEAFGGRYEV